MPTAQQRLDALHRCDTVLIDSYRREIAQLRYEQQMLLHRLAAGGEVTLHGKPVRLEWPDGTPFGLEREQLGRLIPEPLPPD
jgi:hypothetical protein